MHARFSTSIIGYVLGLAFLLAHTVVHADTITVCWDGSGDYVTIQEGIDAAVDGDEVVVCDGTYTGDGNRDLDFRGKAITVRSANGPENCTIDCEGSRYDPHRGFHFGSGETAASVLDGVTITNGYVVGRGGAIACEANSNPTITRCVFSTNTVWADEIYGGGGGAINCWESSPVIDDCVFLNNLSDGGSGGITAGGGAIHCGEYSSPLITRCTFDGNVANADYRSGDIPSGGAVYAFLRSHPIVIECTFTENFAWWGGGLFSYTGATVSNSTFERNTAFSGGGIFGLTGDLEVRRCLISENRAITGPHGVGGGGLVLSGNARASECVIVGNTSSSVGGGILSESSYPIVAGCVIAENAANEFGGGISAYGSALLLVNCEITDNDASHGGGVSIYQSNLGVATFANCLFSGNIATDSGGALHLDQASTAAIINSTLTGNAAGQNGGAVYSGRWSNVFINNSVLWSDVAPFGSELALGNDCFFATEVAFSDVRGGQEGVYVPGDCELTWGDGNIDADPLFVDSDNGDFRLSAGSPCIDAADNTAVPADTLDLDGDGDADEPIPFDLGGNRRFVDDPETGDTGNGTPPIVDMGAYEFQACVGDLDGDGDVDQSDLGVLLSDWGCQSNCVGDIDGDDDTDQADMGILLGSWGCGT